MKKYLPLLMVLGLFAALLFCSGPAAAGAKNALAVCGATLAPSLLPFFTLSNLLSGLGLPDLLGGRLGGPMSRLFHVSPAGAQAFLLGVTGGYPLGASAAADLYRTGRVSRAEAERLAAFCNNSGPAFILGAAGAVFKSPRAGLLLYATHVLGAAAVGVLFRGKDAPARGNAAPSAPPLPFGKAMTQAVSRAVTATVTVCGYVVLFGAFIGVLTPILPQAPLARALITGFLELGGGIAAFRGLSPTPLHLACAALILGWGGLSVHCQTMGVLADTDMSCARHLAGRALCGILAAVFTYLGAALLL